eukprot:90365_1
MSEDCLYLNIFSPNIINGSVSGELLPVMFWIHGGGFTSGSGSWALYDGAGFMVNKDVIYVSINYRLGSLGFLALEETSGRTSGGLNGIIDIITALQFVQLYISDFGGDPSRVTIFGESAGGLAICFLLVTEHATNLFDRAIIESGIYQSGLYGNRNITSKEESILNSKSILSNVNLTDDINELKQLNASKFLEFPLKPTVDGYIINDSLYNMYFRKPFQLNTNKLIVGFTSLDTFIFGKQGESSDDTGPKNENELKYYLRAYIHDNDVVDKIMDTFYPIHDFDEYIWHGEIITNYEMLWYSINTDVCMICPSINFIQLLQEHNMSHNVYLYNFLGPAEPYYVLHGGEMPFVFNSSFTAKVWLDIEWNNELSYFVTETWENFAVYDVPNSTIFPIEWLPFDSNGTTMIFANNNGYIENDYLLNYRNGACQFWLTTQSDDVITSLCSDLISVEISSDEKKGLEIWEIAVLSVAIVIVVTMIIVLIKYKLTCSKQKKGGYITMNHNTDDNMNSNELTKTNENNRHQNYQNH